MALKSISIKQFKTLTGKSAKRSKYNAKPVWACSECYANTEGKDNCCSNHPDSKLIYFHSTGEFNYWHQLLLLQKAGDISELKRQVRFDIEHNGVKITRYTADFSYVKNDEYIVIDYKGKDTDASKLRRKLTLAFHGIDVKLVLHK